MKSVLIAAALVVATAAAAGAQDNKVALAPGNSALNVARITAGTDSFVIENYRQGSLFRSTRLVREVHKVNVGGRAMLRQSQTYATPDGTTVDTTWIDAATLAPVRYYADIYGEIQRFEFDGVAVKGTVVPKDSAARDASFNAPAPFFNAVAMDLVHQAYKFDEGSAVGFPIYNPPRGSIEVALKFVAHEKLPLKNGGTIGAIRLSFNSRSHLWIDAKDGRLLINGGGMGGNAFWKVRTDIDASALIKASL